MAVQTKGKLRRGISHADKKTNHKIQIRQTKRSWVGLGIKGKPSAPYSTSGCAGGRGWSGLQRRPRPSATVADALHPQMCVGPGQTAPLVTRNTTHTVGCCGHGNTARELPRRPAGSIPAGQARNPGARARTEVASRRARQGALIAVTVPRSANSGHAIFVPNSSSTSSGGGHRECAVRRDVTTRRRSRNAHAYARHDG